jgi:hypothetical protein
LIISQEFGISVDINAILKQNMAKLNQFALPQKRLNTDKCVHLCLLLIIGADTIPFASKTDATSKIKASLQGAAINCTPNGKPFCC